MENSRTMSSMSSVDLVNLLSSKAMIVRGVICPDGSSALRDFTASSLAAETFPILCMQSKRQVRRAFGLSATTRQFRYASDFRTLHSTL